jgi:hypothetical protein
MYRNQYDVRPVSYRNYRRPPMPPRMPMQQRPPFPMNNAQGMPFQPPYPPAQPGPRPPFHGVLNHFKKEDGKLDFDKMFATANQVSGVVKQVSPIFQLFKAK